MKFFKSISVGFLALVLLANALVIPAVYLDFEVRKDFIQNVLCVNKQKPITVCGGKCYLSKELQKALDQTGNEEASSFAQLDISYPIPSQSSLCESVQTERYDHEYFISHDSGKSSRYVGTALKPPIA